MLFFHQVLPLMASILFDQATSAPLMERKTSTTTSCSGKSGLATTTSSLESLTLPKTISGTQLPVSNSTLLHVTLGHGIQNYTCASAYSTPVATGALATLYDVSTLSESALVALPPMVAYMSLPYPPSSPFAVTDSLHVPAGSATAFSVIGHHYFAADTTPTFDLSAVSQLLKAKKESDIEAPINASPGVNGMGAVDWLLLADKGGSVGLGSVYRVVTAGGSATTTCEGQGVNGKGVGTISVPYAALYWFYK